METYGEVSALGSPENVIEKNSVKDQPEKAVL